MPFQFAEIVQMAREMGIRVPEDDLEAAFTLKLIEEIDYRQYVRAVEADAAADLDIVRK